MAYPTSICLQLVLMVAIFAGCRPNTTGSNRDSGQSETRSVTPSDLSGGVVVVPFRRLESPSVSEFAYENGRDGGGFTILEIVGGGVGAIDFDLDGSVDLFFPGGGEIDMSRRKVTGVTSALFRGDGAAGFLNATEMARIDTSGIYSHGVSAADFDNDGFPDLLISGYQGVQLWRNLGDGTFLDVTDEAGLGQVSWTTSTAWLDSNDDGALDLYLVSYVE